MRVNEFVCIEAGVGTTTAGAGRGARLPQVSRATGGRSARPGRRAVFQGAGTPTAAARSPKAIATGQPRPDEGQKHPTSGLRWG